MKKMQLIIAMFLSLSCLAPVTFCIGAATAGTSAKSQVVPAKININTATEQELTNIPGVGMVKAERIIALRKESGKFSSYEDLLRVKGIGEKTLKKMTPFMTL